MLNGYVYIGGTPPPEKFVVGDRVQAMGNLNLRTSAGGSLIGSRSSGDKGTIVLDNYGDKITLFIPEIEPETEKIDTEKGYIGEYENFFNAIRKEEPIVSTLEKAYKDLWVLMKAMESAGVPFISH